MSQFNVGDRVFTLHRLPPVHENSPLQAWDTADDYLLQAAGQTAVHGATLIFNDTFGALACALAGNQTFSISDSYLSQLATQKNLALNGLSVASVTLLDSLAPLPAAPARVLLKIPKSLALLEHQLRALRQVVTAETQIVAAGKVNAIHRSTLELFSRVLGTTTTSLAVKKARLIYCIPSFPALAEVPETRVWPLVGTPYQIHNHASVFARTSLDIGARFFMAHLPENISGEIVDLGCGNGVIGLMALTHNPDASVHFVDESMMAVASSQRNIACNRPQDLSRCHFRVNNALAGFAAGIFHAVFCNPPFHQQNTLTDHIARQMFQDAHRCLVRGGELRIVSNRHLGYYAVLKKLFGNCATVAASQKFVILRAVKTR